MRCTKHIYDISSTIGVCASCLRHRLFSLIHLQFDPTFQFPPNCNNSNPKPNPNLRFPRSISQAKKPQNSAGDKLGLVSKLFRSKSLSSAKSAVVIRRSKGMSPENDWEEIERVESSPARWTTRPSPGRVRPSPARSASSMAFCLSPLVRSSPARRRSGGGGCEKLGVSGEIRVPAKGKCKGNNDFGGIPHLYAAASFCGNRSRKLADFGRFNVNY
ncbi:uncharacterized protein LOC141594165 [Silene latifolia]|uniref:uncharacterized protein LOC141594165 n=1 Tax=Silene latifolia TaxID=37657 RepID=UPI003D76C159